MYLTGMAQDCDPAPRAAAARQAFMGRVAGAVIGVWTVPWRRSGAFKLA